MTFGKPSSETTATGAFPYKSVLPSYWTNYIDNTYPNILDKTGDSITGLVKVTNGGEILITTDGYFILDGYGTFNVNTGIMILNNSALVLGGSSSILVASTANLTFQTGGSIIGAASVTGSIIAENPNSITSAVAGGISSGVVSGIKLNAGSNDWVTFTAPRALSSNGYLNPLGLIGSGWSASGSGGIGFYGPGTSSSTAFVLDLSRWNGATLLSIDVYFAVTSVHTGVPAVLPSIQAYSFGLSTSASPTTTVSLNVITPIQYFPTPGSGAAWTASGGQQKLTFTPTAGTLIDTHNYLYQIVLIDENGANSISGNVYLGMVCNYTVPNMQFK